MKAIILAAGRGSRMQELTESSPKCLVHLAGKPLLHYQLQALKQAGITEIGIVCGYQHEKIQDPRISKKFINSDWQITNMVSSLMCATEWLAEDDCIISYSDIFYAASAIDILKNSPSDIAITYDINFYQLWSARFNDPLGDLETFRLDEQNNLLEIGSRTTSITEIQGQYMGLLKLTPAGWKEIKNILHSYDEIALRKLDMTHLLQQLITAKVRIKALAYSDCWGEVDQASDLALYESWEIT
ncbi:MAG: phosphocholine cytidylyltransferase family protein [Gammaproteobacteria bacterium]